MARLSRIACTEAFVIAPLSIAAVFGVRKNCGDDASQRL